MTALRPVRPGDTFTHRRDGTVFECRREIDDPAPAHACERMRVTHLATAGFPAFAPYTFGAEQEWFRQRGLVAA